MDQVAVANSVSPFNKLPSEVVDVIIEGLDPRDARNFSETNRRHHELAMKRGWHECTLAQLWMTVPAAVRMLILKEDWDATIDQVSLSAIISDKAQDPLGRYWRHVRVLNIRYPFPALRSSHIKTLMACSPFTPHLDKLVVDLRIRQPSTLADAEPWIKLCAPSSLRTFSIPTYYDSDILGFGLELEHAYRILQRLMETGIELRELELDHPWQVYGELLPPPNLNSGLNRLVGGITLLSLDEALFDLFTYEVLGSLPHLTVLKLQQLCNLPGTLSTEAPDSNSMFPSLRTVEFVQAICQVAGELIELYIPPRLQAVRFRGLPLASSSELSTLLRTLERHRDTLQVLHVEMELEEEISSDFVMRLTHLPAMAMEAISQLQQLREFSFPRARTDDHQLFLQTCRSWPLLTRLDMPHQWVSADIFKGLASTCPRLACLSIAIFAMPTPALPEVTLLPDSCLDEDDAASIAVISDTPLEVTCSLDTRFNWHTHYDLAL
ncbi:hypothetical protein FRC11_014271 [Ceratobasidium sp. 423]|nr:hypothetical protein FRC11_014271 [Ceratobasidium sp. 423]